MARIIAPVQGDDYELKLINNGRQLMYRHTPEGEPKGQWVRAVYHCDVFDDLFDEAGKKGTYVCDRASGKDDRDQTAFLKSQESWGEDQAHRPNILFMIEPTDGCEVGEMPDTFMVRNGQLVLDSENQRIKDFAELPATISTQIEGWHLEAIFRLNNAIAFDDIRVRMLPRAEIHKDDKFPSRNTLNMRRGRYRQRTSSVSWVPRQGTEEFKEAILGTMERKYLIANSTKGRPDIPIEKTKRLWEQKQKDEMGKGKGKKASAKQATTEKGESSTAAKAKGKVAAGRVSKTKKRGAARDDESYGEPGPSTATSSRPTRTRSARKAQIASEDEEMPDVDSDDADSEDAADDDEDDAEETGTSAVDRKELYRTANTFIFTPNAIEWASGSFTQGDTKLTMSVHEDDDPRKNWEQDPNNGRAFQRSSEFNSKIPEGKWTSMTPGTDAEVRLLLDAIAPTLDVYRSVTLEKPPEYKEGHSYGSYYAKVQREYEKHEKSSIMKLPRLNLVNDNFTIWSIGDDEYAVDIGDLAQRLKAGLCGED